MFIEPTITWVPSGFSGYIWLDTKLCYTVLPEYCDIDGHSFQIYFQTNLRLCTKFDEQIFHTKKLFTKNLRA